jgi:glycerol-3-phosphate dehydrogenase
MQAKMQYGFMENYTDIFIIGGGVNGTAIAADAAGRGLSVTLCEKNDLASGTSSACSKLIHGGLRYLELYEFGLVHSALQEREVLLSRAPHLIFPLEFILPHEKHLRPAWLIRLGLFFYDHLARRRYLPCSRALNLQKDMHGTALLPKFKKGFSYYDCFVDDSRFVIANALSAQANNAKILTRSTFISAKREKIFWKIELEDNTTKNKFYTYAKTIINVAGPWVKEVHNTISSDLFFEIELDKGSHIIVPKLYEGDFAYILQNSDQRVIFAIPFQEKFTLIGTTDNKFSANLDTIKISPTEEEYLCKIINQYFKKPINKTDIIGSFAGVRCLQASDKKNPATITRDYKLLIEDKNNLPLVTVIGGKFTTHRILAEQTLAKLKPYFTAMGKTWTANHPLPGGDIPNQDFAMFLKQFKLEFPWLPSDMANRYAKNYGTRAYLLLKDAKKLSDLGIEIGKNLYQNEVEFLIQHEWARTIEDILWRRTKLGLFFSVDEIKNLQNYLNK